MAVAKSLASQAEFLCIQYRYPQLRVYVGAAPGRTGEVVAVVQGNGTLSSFEVGCCLIKGHMGESHSSYRLDLPYREPFHRNQSNASCILPLPQGGSHSYHSGNMLALPIPGLPVRCSSATACY